jgi:hypothetical protein
MTRKKIHYSKGYGQSNPHHHYQQSSILFLLYYSFIFHFVIFDLNHLLFSEDESSSWLCSEESSVELEDEPLQSEEEENFLS